MVRTQKENFDVEADHLRFYKGYGCGWQSVGCAFDQ